MRRRSERSSIYPNEGAWTNRALEHLLDIYEYIAKDLPVYAKRTIDNLTRRSEQIGAHPGSGRVVPEYEADEIREVIEAEYRLIYQFKTDRIDVIAVVHSCRHLTNE